MNRNQKIVISITAIIILLVAATSIYSIMREDGGLPYAFKSLRGEQVEIYGGNGVYAYNTVDKAIMSRAFDWFFLFGGIPIMVIGIVLFLRKSAIGYFILLSGFFLYIYNYIINSIDFAYNEYFLIYIAVYVAGIFGAVSAMRSVSIEHIKRDIVPRLPVKLISVYLFLASAYFLSQWLIIDFNALITGIVHPDLDIYTTAGLNITDLSIFVTISITAGIMLLRGKPLGAMIAVGMTLMIFQEMVALSIYTLSNAAYLKEGIDKVEWPLVALIPISLTITILSVRKLKGIKYVLRNDP